MAVYCSCAMAALWMAAQASLLTARKLTELFGTEVGITRRTDIA